MSSKVPVAIDSNRSAGDKQRVSNVEVKIGGSHRRGGVPRLAVTPAGFDDVGQVLKTMGYEFQALPDSKLGTSDLSDIDVLFLNCSGTCHSYAAAAGHSLRRYVAAGGSIYGSDFAAAYLAQAFPDDFRYREGGQAGPVTAGVVDRGLQHILGDQVKLNFDLPDWRIISYLSAGHRKYLVADGRPLLVSFAHGKGQVLYTAFHNHTQPTEQETALLNFLVLKPLTAKNAPRFEMLSAAGKKSIQDIPGLASAGLTKTFEYLNHKSQTLVFLLNWSGQAEFELSVYRPSGVKFSTIRSSSAPCVVRCPAAESGSWQYTIESLKVPYPNFHYSATVGTADILQALPSPG